MHKQQLKMTFGRGLIFSKMMVANVMKQAFVANEENLHHGE